MVPVAYSGSTVRIEYARLNFEKRNRPLIVFLHEGLGSVSTWHDFPERLCAEGGYRGLVYSRPGHGQSTVPPALRERSLDFMHDQARQLLPGLLTALDIDAGEPIWLLGHSEGGSIALIYGASFPARVAGLVVVAPHIYVEDVAIARIAATRFTYETTDWSERLARHHVDPDGAFWGWYNMRLDPRFRTWNIESMLGRIRCPVLAVQGRDDAYGTLAQIEGIAKAIPQAELVALNDCGHSVHRHQPERLVRATVDFIARQAGPS
jgi:pimeloyl-ACP methyl ester carboxylesterase